MEIWYCAILWCGGEHNQVLVCFLSGVVDPGELQIFALTLAMPVQRFGSNLALPQKMLETLFVHGTERAGNESPSNKVV